MTGLTQISAIETPAVLLDLAKLESNLSSMQQLADRHGVALRPHAKTHKSVEIAKRQLALGATGLTVATVGEALVFIRSGIRSITISRPMVRPSDFARLWAEPATAGADLRVVVDSARRVEVGAQVRIVPNHSCPVANLAREYMVLDGDGIAPWSVDAASNAS